MYQVPHRSTWTFDLSFLPGAGHARILPCRGWILPQSPWSRIFLLKSTLCEIVDLLSHEVLTIRLSRGSARHFHYWVIWSMFLVRYNHDQQYSLITPESRDHLVGLNLGILSTHSQLFKDSRSKAQ